MSDNALDLPYDFVFESKCLGGAHAEYITPNIPSELFEIHRKIVEGSANNFFNKNASLFLTVGIEIDDLRSICMCYLSSFLSHQTVLVEGYNRDRYLEQYAISNGPRMEPEERDFIEKDTAILILFLRQRLTNLLQVMMVKRKDINGFYSRNVIYLVDKEIPLDDTRSLAWLSKEDKEKLGFFKVTGQKMEYIKKKIKNVQVNSFFKFEGKTYFKHQLIQQNNLSVFYEKEEESTFDTLKNRFNNLPETKKLLLIKKFMKKNKDKPSKQKELDIAQALLKESRID